jgi:hypothetical protein
MAPAASFKTEPPPPGRRLFCSGGAAMREERLHEVERLYRDPATPVDECAARLGVGRSRFYQIVKDKGWPLRHPERSRAVRAALDTVAPLGETRSEARATREVDGAVVNARLLRALAKRLLAFEREMRRDADPEQLDRRLAMLTRIAGDIQRLAASTPAREESHGTDRPSRSLDALRDQLFQHMRRLRERSRYH